MSQKAGSTLPIYKITRRQKSMERVNKTCSVCGKTVSVPVNVQFMIASNLTQARNHGACAYCEKCNACYCFDHILWIPSRISKDSETMTNVAVCPKCEELMGGLPV